MFWCPPRILDLLFYCSCVEDDLGYLEAELSHRVNYKVVGDIQI